MRRITLAMTENVCADLVASLAETEETAFVGAVGVADLGDEGFTICIRQLSQVDETSYVERSRYRLVITSAGFMPAFGRARRLGAGAVFAHSHPSGFPSHSKLDDLVDTELGMVGHLRTGSHYVSVIVAGTRDHPEFTARVTTDGRTFAPVDRIRVVGEDLRIFQLQKKSHGRAPDQDLYDRQIRVFGAAGQAVLADLRVGVVGAGGTGSVVCEQLVRLGIGEVLIVDDDVVTESNISRLFGSTTSDIGVPKVKAVAEALCRVRESAKVVPIVGRVGNEAIVRRLRGCDVVFGCTDDQLGRSILSRLSYWYLLPFIDMGVIITREGDRVREVISRVTLVGPNHACLLCRGRLQPDVIRAEALHPDERQRLAAEGYVQGFGEPDPSVVTYTSLTASLATSLFIQRLFGFDHTAMASELLVRIDSGEMRRNRVAPREGHYCADADNWGTADSDPFLGQLWA